MKKFFVENNFLEGAGARRGEVPQCQVISPLAPNVALILFLNEILWNFLFESEKGPLLQKLIKQTIILRRFFRGKILLPVLQNILQRTRMTTTTITSRYIVHILSEILSDIFTILSVLKFNFSRTTTLLLWWETFYGS